MIKSNILLGDYSECDDTPRDECGIFAVYGNLNAANLTYFGLYALQHRGQESAGIISFDGKHIFEHKAMGLVPDVFTEPILAKLKGHMAIGHVRYSTVGSSLLINAQPFRANIAGQNISLAHNGNIINSHIIRKNLEDSGSIFQTTMDSEVVLHLIARNIKNGIENAVIEAMKSIKGAYSMSIMTKDSIVAFRDPNGFRPLSIGKLDNAYIISSETCAFDLVGAEFIRDIQPGEICIIDNNGIRSIDSGLRSRKSQCIFELIYFARPDSTVYGQNVYLFRKKQGQLLAKNFKPDVDLVMPFPDSGSYAAIGYAQESGIPFEMGVIRNHYVGRTFIQPSQRMRDFGVKVKLNPVKPLLKNKRILIVEDSIVRGTTAKTRVAALQDTGAKEIHMAVACPPHRFPCHYGIDFNNKGELIAASKSQQEICDFIGLKSLAYLTIDDLVEATCIPRDHLCFACFDGNYPVPVDNGFTKTCMEKDCECCV